MAQSEPASEAPREVIRVPRVLFERRSGDGEPGQESLHVHVHLPGKTARSGRAFLGIAGGGVALVVAFLAGVISAGSPSSAPSAAELAALQRLAGLPAPPPATEGTPATGMPLLPLGGMASPLPPSGGTPSMPAGLQQLLSQPPRVQPPPSAAPAPRTRAPAAPGAAASPPIVEGTPTRNAFGLEN